MKKALAIAFAALIALTMSACAEPTPAERVQDRVANNVITVDYNGKPLDCITWGGSHGELGMTCDFVKYHAENE